MKGEGASKILNKHKNQSKISKKTREKKINYKIIESSLQNS